MRVEDRRPPITPQLALRVALGLNGFALPPERLPEVKVTPAAAEFDASMFRDDE